MIKRFFVIVGAVSLFSVLTAAPAFAATAKFVPPTPSSGQTVTGTQTIQVEATTNPGVLGLGAEMVDGIKITIRRAGTTVKEFQGPGKSLRVSWDTGPLNNGGYDIDAVATAQQPGRDTVSNLMVNNPPAKPAGLKCSQQENSVSCSWNANKEADLIDYEVRRSVNNAPFAKVADVKSATYKDTSAPLDQPVRYQVIASRRSATGGSIDSAASDPSAAVTISPAPPSAAVPDPAAAAAPPPPAPATAPRPGQSPVAQKFFGKASFRTLPARDVGFEPTLPFTAPIPQKFEPPTTENNPAFSDTGADSGQLSGTLTQVHPARFLAAGLLLLVTSAHLARASRRLLKSGSSSSRRPTPASPVSQGT
jgi:hypothetical protein